MTPGVEGEHFVPGEQISPGENVLCGGQKNYQRFKFYLHLQYEQHAS